jgi:hypothetical protein
MRLRFDSRPNVPFLAADALLDQISAEVGIDIACFGSGDGLTQTLILDLLFAGKTDKPFRRKDLQGQLRVHEKLYP